MTKYCRTPKIVEAVQFRDCIVDEEELCRFVKEWNAKQTVATYYPDYSRVVVLK